jgi:predicted ester cyclase
MTTSDETTKNKATARRIWEEIFPACDVEALTTVIHPDSIAHDARPDEPPGFEGVKRTMFWLATVFSDQRWEIQHVIGDGDMVAVYGIYHGRHTGNLFGIPPTGREVEFSYVHILRFLDGRAYEHWSVRDDITLMRQLGVMPERPAGVPAPPPQVATAQAAAV